SNTEKYVDVPQRLHLVLLQNGIPRRIEVVTNIQAYRSNRRFIAQSHSDRLRVIAEVAPHRTARLGALRDRRLMEAQHTACNLACGCENVAHIVKENKPEIVAYERERNGRGTNFEVVDEQPLPADGISGLQVAGTRLVDRKAAQRIATTREEQLRQWDRGGFRRQRRFPRGEAEKIIRAVGMQNSDLGVARQHPSLLEGVVARILEQHLAKICLGTQRAGGQSKVGYGVAALVRVNGIVASVPQVRETGNREPDRLRIQRYQCRIDHQAVGIDGYTLPAHPIKQRRDPAVFLLCLEGSIEPLRGKSVHVGLVVIEASDGETPFLFVKQARRIVADEAPTNQQAYPGSKSQGLVATEHIQARDFQHAVGAHSRAALGIAGGRNVAGGELDSTAVTEGPALGFLKIKKHVLGRFQPIRVLDSHVHLVEQAEVVEPSLRVHHPVLAQGISVLDAHLPVHNVGTGEFQPAHDDAIDKELRSLGDGVNHVHALRLVRGRGCGRFELHVRKAVI